MRLTHHLFFALVCLLTAIGFAVAARAAHASAQSGFAECAGTLAPGMPALCCTAYTPAAHMVSPARHNAPEPGPQARGAARMDAARKTSAHAAALWGRVDHQPQPGLGSHANSLPRKKEEPENGHSTVAKAGTALLAIALPVREHSAASLFSYPAGQLSGPPLTRPRAGPEPHVSG